MTATRLDAADNRSSTVHRREPQPPVPRVCSLAPHNPDAESTDIARRVVCIATEDVRTSRDAAHAQFGDEESQRRADYQSSPSSAAGQRPQLDAANSRRAGRRRVTVHVLVYMHCMILNTSE